MDGHCLLIRPLFANKAVKSVGGLYLMVADTIGRALRLQLYTNRGAACFDNVHFCHLDLVTCSHKVRDAISNSVVNGAVPQKEGEKCCAHIP